MYLLVLYDITCIYLQLELLGTQPTQTQLNALSMETCNLKIRASSQAIKTMDVKQTHVDVNLSGNGIPL